MPQTCSVCRSKRLANIDAELIARQPLRSIAKQYRVSSASLFRHKRHLSDKLALAKQHQDTVSAENLLAEMGDLKARLRRGLEQAEKAANAAAFVAFARELRQTLEAYFDISERVAEKTSANSEVRLRVVYGDKQKTGPERNVCERCGQVLDWEEQKRRYILAVSAALGCEASADLAAPCDPELPAGVEPRGPRLTARERRRRGREPECFAQSMLPKAARSQQLEFENPRKFLSVKCDGLGLLRASHLNCVSKPLGEVLKHWVVSIRIVSPSNWIVIRNSGLSALSCAVYLFYLYPTDSFSIRLDSKQIYLYLSAARHPFLSSALSPSGINKLH
jgi:hypothetical protein